MKVVWVAREACSCRAADGDHLITVDAQQRVVWNAGAALSEHLMHQRSLDGAFFDVLMRSVVWADVGQIEEDLQRLVIVDIAVQHLGGVAALIVCSRGSEAPQHLAAQEERVATEISAGDLVEPGIAREAAEQRPFELLLEVIGEPELATEFLLEHGAIVDLEW